MIALVLGLAIIGAAGAFGVASILDDRFNRYVLRMQGLSFVLFIAVVIRVTWL